MANTASSWLHYVDDPACAPLYLDLPETPELEKVETYMKLYIKGIESTNSELASQIVFVQKKDGWLRLCIN